MKSILTSTIIGLTLAASVCSQPAVANDIVTCESKHKRYNTCPIKSNTRVTLKQQTSKNDCTQGRTWDYDERSIWVDKGCKGKFEVHHNNGHTDYSGVPEITARSSGELEVSMSSGCTALYDRRGDLITRGSSCSKHEKRKLNDAVTGYLRETGDETDYEAGNETNYSGTPEITARPSGELEVSMSSGCTALYDRRGDLITRGSSCSKHEKRKLNDAVTSYLREQ